MDLRTVVLCLFVAKVSASASCVGASASLNSTDCAAWQAGYDAMSGSSWTHCSDKRADPCSCDENGRRVTCFSNRIMQVKLHSNKLAGTSLKLSEANER